MGYSRRIIIVDGCMRCPFRFRREEKHDVCLQTWAELDLRSKAMPAYIEPGCPLKEVGKAAL